MIKKYRENANLTQEALARELSVERSTIAKWESKVCFPSSKKLPQLAAVLGCTVDELLKGEEKETK